jgi:imidazoleglycerol phosphate synthase glutamine amidotransferase subunit HisH
MIAVIDYGMENLRSIRNALMMVKIAHALTIVLLSCVFAQYVVSLQCVWLKKRSV